MRIAALSTCASGHDAPSRIMNAVMGHAYDAGHRTLTIFGRGDPLPLIKGERRRVGNRLSVIAHAAASRIADRQGLMSRRATLQAINEIERFNPDIVHLHTLHGHYINYPLLLDFLGKRGCATVATLHDMWLLTGRCSFATGCSRWQSGCDHCPYPGLYPPTLLSHFSHAALRLRQVLLDRIENLTFVAPSKWMQQTLRRSAMRLVPTVVIPDGVDSDFFNRNHPKACSKVVNAVKIVAVANHWEPRKHPEHLLALLPHLHDGERLVMVGRFDKKSTPPPHPSLEVLPFMESRERLAAIYRDASVVVSASESESFGMTIAEAAACGVPAVVNAASALAEHVEARQNGVKCDTSDPEAFLQAIREVVSENSVPLMPCTEAEMARKYLTLFEDLAR